MNQSIGKPLELSISSPCHDSALLSISSHGSPSPSALTARIRIVSLAVGSRNPNYENIADKGVDVLVAHGPVKGYVDGQKGCAELLRLVKRLRPRLVVGGHIHFAHGVAEGQGALCATTFVNAANARRTHHDMGWDPVVIDI